MISDQYLKWILVFFQPHRESFKTSQLYSWSVQSLARCMGSVCVIVILVNGILDLMFQGMESLWITLTKIPLPLSGLKKKGFYGNSNFHMVQISCKCLYAYHIQIVKLTLRFTLLTLLTTVYSWWIDLTAQMSQALPGVSYSVLFDFCIIIHDPAVICHLKTKMRFAPKTLDGRFKQPHILHCCHAGF